MKATKPVLVSLRQENAMKTGIDQQPDERATTPGKGFSLLRIRRRLAPRRFRRDEKGATAVEFALISVPFFMLLMSTVEMALMLWTSQQMEEAVFQGSRTMLTGESRALYNNPATARQQFRDTLCANMTLIVDCPARLQVDVQTFASFATATSNSAVNAGALNTAAFGFQPVTPSTIVVVRAVLSYPLTMSTWSQAFANLSNGDRALMANIAFRTEPFPP
jgi:Flp pilus assembly protein TadG